MLSTYTSFLVMSFGGLNVQEKSQDQRNFVDLDSKPRKIQTQANQGSSRIQSLVQILAVSTSKKELSKSLDSV